MSSSYAHGYVTRCWNGRVSRETDNIQPQEAGGWNVIKLYTRLCNKMLEWESVQGDRQHSATGGRRMECHQVMHKAM